MAMHDLLLRPWVESDASGLREAIDEDVDHLKPWLTWTLEEPTTLTRTRERLRRYAEEWRDGRTSRYAVVPRERPREIFGGVHLKRRTEPSTLEIGYWVRKSAAGEGVAAAAVSRLVIHGFEGRGVDRLVARCDVANDASAAFARTLGFRPAGRVRDTYPDGSARPLLELEMDRHAYGTRHAAGLRRRARWVRLAATAEPPTGESPRTDTPPTATSTAEPS